MGNKEDLGLRIKTMRMSRGLTQQQLAEMINQSQSSITMYETGRREPEMDVLEALADVFNVPMTAFMPQGDQKLTAADIGVLDAMHQNPRLGLLFDRQSKMSSDQVELMLQLASNIVKEFDGE